MTDNSIILPVIIHLVTAVILIFSWNNVSLQKIISITASVAALLTSIFIFEKTWDNGILTTQAGNWVAPFGITFIADVFSCTMVLLTNISAVAVCIFSTVGLRKERMRYGYFPILHFLIMGLCGAFLTGDIFNLYVWFEIIIIASFVLMTLGGRRPQISGGIKYVTINIFASIIFLTAIAILYGLTGSLNIADLSGKVAEVENRGLVNVAAMMFFVSFGIKSAVFPLYFWLPSSYHTPPSVIAAIFSGILTKVGVYALLRMFTLIFVPDVFTTNVIMGVAVATLLTGALGALVQKDLRRIFSFLIVCHIGYMIAGLGMFTEVALTGALFYLVHDVVVKTNIFLVSGLIAKIKGTVELKDLGGLYSTYPKISILIAVVFFSLVGVPPLSGFWPKLFLVNAGFATESYLLIGAILFASFITLYIIARIWSEVFWKEEPVKNKRTFDDFTAMKLNHKVLMVLPIALLALVSVYIGVGAEKVVTVTKHIASEMKDNRPYIKAVLGEPVSQP